MISEKQLILCLLHLWSPSTSLQLCKEQDVLLKRARNELASSSDSARIWRTLRKEGLTVNKNNLNCNSFTVNEMNSFCSTVACAHPPCPSSSLDAIVASIQDIDDSALSFHEITPVEVYEIARMLSSKSKGQSLDGLPWKHLESLLLPLLPFLLKIFNCSISSNTYPDLWKRAFIIPLNKCNNPQLVSNTRPMANLCHLAKVFDKIIATQISQYLETHSLSFAFSIWI